MLEKSQVKLLSGYDASVLSDDDFDLLLLIATEHLQSILCLGALPDPLPSDLLPVLAAYVALFATEKTSDSKISSKSVEDFSISLRTGDDERPIDQIILEKYRTTLAKYGQCDFYGEGVLRSGKVGNWRRQYDRL